MPFDLINLWNKILEYIKQEIGEQAFENWFTQTMLASVTDDSMVIQVPSNFFKDWIYDHYRDILNIAILKTLGKVVPVKFEIKEEAFQKTGGQLSRAQAAPPEKISQKKPFYLNPKYTFDTFVVGKGNELAHAAAQAVAQRPGDAYNPLFIYGGVGLGKTHLIQAIGHTMLETNPQTKILYVSSEKFTNEFVSSIKEGRAKEFKDRYRNVDLLLIDDIQFIGGKEQTQEEFFHTFNELHQQGKQVVMTSDRPPKAIPALEDRLRSRFEWGMIADISAPDLETRMAIIPKKAQEKRFDIDGNLLHLIATNVQSNIRELEGALNKIIAYHELKNTKPNESSIKQLLSSFEEQNMRRSLTPRELISQVSQYFDINVDDVLGKSREKRLAFPRQIIMFLMREELKLSYPSIGDELGGRDHTTAMHAHTKISSEIDQDLKLKQDMEHLLKEVLLNSQKLL